MPIDLLMTQLSPTMTEGRIARWLKKEGDTLESGEVMAEIETDKATMEMEVVDEGVLHRIIADEGATVAVGAPIAVIAEEGEEVPADYQPTAEAATEAEAAPPAPVATPAPAPVVEPAIDSAVDSKRIKASPLARRLARPKGINLAAITGSGPRGRITKGDVEKVARRGISLGAGTAAVGPLPHVRCQPARCHTTRTNSSVLRTP